MAARLLVVDDNEDITLTLSICLKSAGLLVDAFNDPVKALDAFLAGSKKYDLLICDVRMPKMTGFEFVRHVVAQDPCLIVVMMTAFDVYKEEIDRELPSIKIDALLNKPIGMSRLVDMVNTLVMAKKPRAV